MSKIKIESFIDLLQVMLQLLGQILPLEISDMGTIIKPAIRDGVIGGKMSKLFTDNLGRLRLMNVELVAFLGCGHLIWEPRQVQGFCQVCGRTCCARPGCLMTCELSGITVCRRHYLIRKGIVVSSYAQKGLWWFKVNKLAKERQRPLESRKLLEAPRKGNK